MDNPLSQARARTFTVDATGTGVFIYYAYRKAYGLSTFWSGGFQGGFNDPKIVAVTNNYGFTEDYYLYQSSQDGLGVTTIQVQ